MATFLYIVIVNSAPRIVQTRNHIPTPGKLTCGVGTGPPKTFIKVGDLKNTSIICSIFDSTAHQKVSGTLQHKGFGQIPLYLYPGIKVKSPSM